MTPRSQRTGTGCYTKPTPPNCGFFEPTEIEDSFSGQRHRCFLYEDKGCDIGFQRWRVCFYYKSHMALTKFFASEESKDRFIKSLPSETK